MKRVYIGMMAAVMIAAATLTFTACSSEAEELMLPEVPEVPEQTETNHSYTLTVNASKGEEGTRALTIGTGADNKEYLQSTWTVGDVVKVYKNGTELGELKAQNNGASTTLTGTLTTAPTQNDVLTLKYLNNDYSNQEGTLASIAENCDYAVATVTVNSVAEGGAISTTDAAFVNQQAIVKFMLKDQNGQDIQASKLYVTADASTYTITPSAATNVFYVAVPGISEKPVELTVADDERCYYSFTHSSVTFENGNYYPINVKMKNWNEQYLTFEAKEAGATVKCTVGKEVVKSRLMKYIEYRKSGDTQWTHQEISGNTSITIDVSLDNIGDKVMFRGDNTQLATNSGFTTATVFTPNNCYVYGNVMSLLYGDKLANITSFPAGSTFTFARLFSEADLMYNHPYKTLVLPATTLTDYCYSYMFYNCMKLTKAPELPAPTLAEGCYWHMFESCSSLTKAPDLLATEPAKYCYYYMFLNCSSLNSIKCLLSKYNRDNTYYWLSKVAPSGTFYAKSEGIWPTNQHGIPSGWDVSYEQ